MKFAHTSGGPKFLLTVPCGDDACILTVRWALTTNDASCWDRPLSIEILPVSTEESWETIIDLTREDVRLLRGYLDLMLSCPDIRQEADGTWIRKPQESSD